MNKKSLTLMVSLAGLSMVGLSGCDFTNQNPPVSNGKQSQAAPAPAVDVLTINESSVALSHSLEGFVKASQSAEIRPQIGGTLKSINFDEGEEVEEGQILFKIDDSLVRADLSAAKASLSKARANLRSAQREAERSKGLKKVDAISDEQYERATTTLEVAESSIRQAEASIQRQRVLLEYTQIKAPFSGRIGRSYVDVGSLITANQAQALAKVQKDDVLHIDIMLDSKRFLKIQSSLEDQGITKGRLPISLTLEDGSRYPYEAHMLFSEKDISKETGSFLIRLGVENPDGLLMPGMYVRADFTYGQDNQALLVPERAVQRTPQGDATVFVVNDKGVVESRSVEVGQLINQSWRVTSGLEPGERVITKGLQKAKPGAAVNAQESTQGGEG